MDGVSWTMYQKQLKSLPKRADIWLNAKNGSILAESAYGQVENNQIPTGHNQYILKTVEGNIHLRKTK